MLLTDVWSTNSETGTNSCERRKKNWFTSRYKKNTTSKFWMRIERTNELWSYTSPLALFTSCIFEIPTTTADLVALRNYIRACQETHIAAQGLLLNREASMGQGMDTTIGWQTANIVTITTTIIAIIWIIVMRTATHTMLITEDIPTVAITMVIVINTSPVITHIIPHIIILDTTNTNSTDRSPVEALQGTLVAALTISPNQSPTGRSPTLKPIHSRPVKNHKRQTNRKQR